MVAPERSIRVPKRFAAHYGSAKKLERLGFVLNLSETGVALKGTTYAVGTILRVVLRPADARAFELQGKVVWSSEADGSMGVRLTSLNEQYRSFVTRATTGSDIAAVRGMPIPGVDDGGSPSSIPPGFRSYGASPFSTPPGSRGHGVSPASISPGVRAVPAPPSPPARGVSTAASIRGVPMTGMAPVSRPPGGFSPASAPPGPRRPLSLPSPPVERASSPSRYSGSFPRVVAAPASQVVPAPATSVPAEGGPVDVEARISFASLPPVRTVAPGEPARRVRLPRFDGALPAQIGAGTLMDGSGFTANVSRAGLALTCDNHYERGKQVTVIVTTPDDRLVWVAGQISWTGTAAAGQRIGVQILNADDDWTKLVGDVARKFR